MTAPLSRYALRYYDQSFYPGLGGGGTPPPVDPSITTLTPNTGVVGVEVTVTVTGTNFDAGSVVEINQVPAPGGTTFVSATTLTITETPAVVGNANVTVRNANDEESNTVVFIVTAAADNPASDPGATPAPTTHRRKKAAD